MTEQSVWDDPAAQIGGDFIQWTNPGDSVVGTVTSLGLGTDFNGAPCPELLIDTGGDEPKVLTVGQVRLKAEMLEKRPKVGDHISVTFTHVEQRAGGKGMKHFAIVVNGGTTPQAAPVAAPVAETSAATPDLSALGLNPEQLAALQNLQTAGTQG